MGPNRTRRTTDKDETKRSKWVGSQCKGNNEQGGSRWIEQNEARKTSGDEGDKGNKGYQRGKSDRI